MPWSCWACVPAPLMPDVALEELPPMNLKKRVNSGRKCRKKNDGMRQTLACREGEHWLHAREECELLRDQQDHHRLR